MHEPVNLEKTYDDDDDDDTSEDRWYSWFGYGAASFASAGFLWWYFSDFEASGGTRRVNVVLAVLYNLLGKVPTVGIFAAVGVVFCVVGANAFARRNKADGLAR